MLRFTVAFTPRYYSKVERDYVDGGDYVYAVLADLPRQ